MIKKNFAIPLILAAAIILLAGCGDNNGVEATTRPVGTMSGTITSILNDQPILNGTVAVEIWSVPIPTSGPANDVGGMVKILTYADQNGQYHVADVPIGRIWIRASATDYKRSPPKYWALSPDAKGVLNFTLYPGVGDEPFDPPSGWEIVGEGDRMHAFDPCNPGFNREGPHDKKKCGDK
jgi:hypothetical protein